MDSYQNLHFHEYATRGSIDGAVGDKFILVPCFEARILFAASDLVDPDIATFDCTQLEDHKWFMAIFVFAKPIISLTNIVFNENKFGKKEVRCEKIPNKPSFTPKLMSHSTELVDAR